MRQSFGSRRRKKNGKWNSQTIYADQIKAFGVLCAKAFEESAVDEVILVTGEDEIDYCKEYIVDRYHFNKVKKIVPGGWERYASVYFGLEAIEDADYVLIHDGARPMISAELVQKMHILCKKNIVQCVVGMPSKDTIKVVDEENYAIRTPERKTLWQVQTPQMFLNLTL